jgi:hypothetical protein
MASSANFFENCRNISRSSTCTMTDLVLSTFFCSMCLIQTISNDDSHILHMHIYLLSYQHFGISSLGVLQKDFVDRELLLKFTECLYTVENTLMEVLVDWHCDKFGLSQLIILLPADISVLTTTFLTPISLVQQPLLRGQYCGGQGRSSRMG